MAEVALRNAMKSGKPLLSITWPSTLRPDVSTGMLTFNCNPQSGSACTGYSSRLTHGCLLQP